MPVMSDSQALTDGSELTPAAVDEMEFYSTVYGNLAEFERNFPVIPLKNGGFLNVTQPFVAPEVVNDLAFEAKSLQDWQDKLNSGYVSPVCVLVKELGCCRLVGYWKRGGKFAFKPDDMTWLAGTWQFVPDNRKRPGVIMASVAELPGYVRISIKGAVGCVDMFQPQRLHNVARLFNCGIEQAGDALSSAAQWTLIDAVPFLGGRARLLPLNPRAVRGLEFPYDAFVTNPAQACFGGMGTCHPVTGFRMASQFEVDQHLREQLADPQNTDFFNSSRWVVESHNTGKVVSGHQLREALIQKGKAWIHRMP